MVALSADPSSAFHNLIDRTRVGVAGHSAGAETTLGVALDTCCRDMRVKAAVILPGGKVTYPFGTYPSPDRTPVIFLHGTSGESTEYSSGISAYHDVHPPKFFVTLDGSDHTDAFVGDLTRPDDRVVTTTTIDSSTTTSKATGRRSPSCARTLTLRAPPRC
jgi:pimeloyl-ACP methyl ester carboxylesterase